MAAKAVVYLCGILAEELTLYDAHQRGIEIATMSRSVPVKLKLQAKWQRHRAPCSTSRKVLVQCSEMLLIFPEKFQGCTEKHALADTAD